MVRDVLKSFFRTIGRILAYLLVGAILSYLFAYFKPVKATTIETDEFYLSILLLQVVKIKNLVLVLFHMVMRQVQHFLYQ